MNGKIIVIEGYLASGKSTFAVDLSRTINVPCFVKDTFKIALCESVSIVNREEGSRFSAVTFDAMMYVAQMLMEVGYPFIIEGNFVPLGIKKVDEAGVIRALIERYAYQSLTYKFMGNTQVLYNRYIERNRLPERGDANREFEEPSYDVFDTYCRNLDGFNIGGEVIIVDTTDFRVIDFLNHMEKARLFME